MNKKNKICFIIGTRPEIIKMAPIIHLCEKQGMEYSILRTGQHYSPEMDAIFYDELKVRKPDFRLSTEKSPSWLKDTILRIRKLLLNLRPDMVLVEGDTNSVLAGAVAAHNCNIPVCHVEAGLRSFNSKMPEERNRIIADNLSAILCAPTQIAKDNLLSEGINPGSISITGNTIADALMQNISLIKEDYLNEVGLLSKKYILATLHRQQNVDDKQTLVKILESIQRISEYLGLQVIMPIHPRTKNSIKKFGIEVGKGIRCIEPVGYFNFLALLKNARCVFTDSGGVIEEACILNVPSLNFREESDRPETIAMKASILVDLKDKNFPKKVKDFIENNPDWQNPYGKGDAAIKIVQLIKDYLGIYYV